MQTHYQSSKGPMAISAMPLPYAKNAYAKLEREGDPTRAPEMEAIAAHIAAAEDTPPTEEPNPRVRMGANNPPPPSTYEAIKVHIEDLYAEAKHWLDGAEIASQAEADKVTKLLDDMRDAHQLADAARVKENEPFDLGKAQVQEKYAPLIADTKKAKGMAVRVVEGCKAALGPWRDRLRLEAEAAAKKAREEADAKIQQATDAARAAVGNDLDAQEAAEALVQSAKVAEREANRAAKDATSGLGLQTYWEPVLTDQRAAVLHYMREQPQRFIDLCMELARIDVRSGKRQIEGFAVKERKRVI